MRISRVYAYHTSGITYGQEISGPGCDKWPMNVCTNLPCVQMDCNDQLFIIQHMDLSHILYTYVLQRAREMKLLKTFQAHCNLQVMQLGISHSSWLEEEMMH